MDASLLEYNYNRVIVIDIANIAAFIENHYSDVIYDYPAGIYLLGTDKPVILPKEYYYRIIRNGVNDYTEIPVSCYDDLEGVIYDKNGEMVLNGHMTYYKDKFLKLNAPFGSVFGRKVVLAYANDLLDTLQLFKGTPFTNQSLRAVYKEWIRENTNDSRCTFENFIDYVHTMMYEVRTAIMKFTNNRTWSIIIASSQHDQLKIEDKGDYRIHKFIEEHGNEYLSKPTI